MNEYKQKTVVNLIRSIMRLSGKTRVWNNLYEGGVRTIKCYRTKCEFGSAVSQVDTKLKDTLRKVLEDLKIDYKIKLTEPSKSTFYNPGTGGFIVRLPVEI